LLHKKEIQKLLGKTTQKGYTIVPVEVYLNKGLVKVQIALAKGKKLYDKREALAQKDQRREAERDFKVSLH
jgi:SsrA-binding protein